jgi:hypothetical protein
VSGPAITTAKSWNSKYPAGTPVIAADLYGYEHLTHTSGRAEEFVDEAKVPVLFSSRPEYFPLGRVRVDVARLLNEAKEAGDSR